MKFSSLMLLSMLSLNAFSQGHCQLYVFSKHLLTEEAKEILNLKGYATIYLEGKMTDTYVDIVIPKGSYGLNISSEKVKGPVKVDFEGHHFDTGRRTPRCITKTSLTEAIQDAPIGGYNISGERYGLIMLPSSKKFVKSIISQLFTTPEGYFAASEKACRTKAVETALTQLPNCKG